MDVWRGEMTVLEGGRWMARGDRFDAPDETGKQVGLSGRWSFDGERLFTFANEDVPAKLRDASAAEAARGLDMDKRADRQEARKFIRTVAGDHSCERTIAELVRNWVRNELRNELRNWVRNWAQDWARTDAAGADMAR